MQIIMINIAQQQRWLMKITCIANIKNTVYNHGPYVLMLLGVFILPN